MLIVPKELSDLNIRYLYTRPRGRTTPNDSPVGHGTCVVAKIGGRTLGIAREATEMVVTVLNFGDYISESWLDGLRMVYDDIKAKKLEKTSVVNLSISLELKSDGGTTGVSQAMINKMGKFKVLRC